MAEENREEKSKKIPMIQVKNLYKVYKVGDTKVYALGGVDFTVYKGEFCAIVGPSGSGKSTLLNMMAGLEKPSKGEIVIAGKHIEKLTENQLVAFRMKHMANEMSGGQQQRVGIARALAVDPQIIFADEPTGNLDSKTTKEILGLMRKIVREQNQTLVMVTHDNYIAGFADRQLHIVDGKIFKIEEQHHDDTEEETENEEER